MEIDEAIWEIKALRAQQEKEHGKTLRDELLKISALMLSYSEDCFGGSDVCSECQFAFFCEDEMTPMKIADIIQETVHTMDRLEATSHE